MKNLVFLSILFFLGLACSCSKDEPKNNDNKINGKEFVDLGLSVKWAVCNVGASFPEEAGNYYSWSSTKPNVMLDYPDIDPLTAIEGTRYDAAYTSWGGSWRMPTDAEIMELIEKCVWIWTTSNGVNGYKVTGPSGKSIFLPAAGSLTADLGAFNETGLYWSADRCASPYEYNGYGLHFTKREVHMTGWNLPDLFTIRPVTR